MSSWQTRKENLGHDKSESLFSVHVPSYEYYPIFYNALDGFILVNAIQLSNAV